LLRRPVTRFFDRLATGWDERVGTGTPERTVPLLAALKGIERPPARALDVGTGTGPVAFLLARAYPDAQVLGVDISSEMISVARENTPAELRDRVRFEVADVATADLGRFDLVTMQNMPPFFEAVAKLTAPGGYVAHVSSIGARTPFFTTERALRRGFEARGLRTVEAGRAGQGTFYLAERGQA
jgi:SAM-dependent methyltransferase